MSGIVSQMTYETRVDGPDDREGTPIRIEGRLAGNLDHIPVHFTSEPISALESNFVICPHCRHSTCLEGVEDASERCDDEEFVTTCLVCGNQYYWSNLDDRGYADRIIPVEFDSDGEVVERDNEDVNSGDYTLDDAVEEDQDSDTESDVTASTESTEHDCADSMSVANYHRWVHDPWVNPVV